MSIKLRRIGPGGYETRDGRFTINKIWCGGDVWQVRAQDGSTPFRGFRKPRSCSTYNCDSLREARDEIDLIYDEEREPTPREQWEHDSYVPDAEREVDEPLRYVLRFVVDDAMPDDREPDPALYEYRDEVFDDVEAALARGKFVIEMSPVKWYQVSEERFDRSEYQGIGGWVDSDRYWVDGVMHYRSES